MQYCLGFAFSVDRRKLLLIRKNRPAWQAGRLNGIGGKLEPGEAALDAMRRETLEETGLRIDAWQFFATIEGRDFTVTCFRAFSDDIFHAASLTDEPVMVLDVNLEQLFAEGNPSVAPLVAHALRPDSGTITVPFSPEHDYESRLLKVMSYELQAPDVHGDNQTLLDRVRRRNEPDAFVIRRGSKALNHSGVWEWEGRQPDEAFRARTRFEDERTALQLWAQVSACTPSTSSS